MLSSIGGQNERWAQIAALRPLPPSQTGQENGLGLGNAGTATTDLPPISPIAGSTASPLSSDTNFLLAVFGGAARPPARTGGTGAVSGSSQGETVTQMQQQANTQSGMPLTGNTAMADGITGTSLVQELQALASASGSVPVASNGAAAASAASSGSSTGDGAIRNGDTAAPSWQNGWDSAPEAGGVARQQIGQATYASWGELSGQSSATASLLQGVTA